MLSVRPPVNSALSAVTFSGKVFGFLAARAAVPLTPSLPRGQLDVEITKTREALQSDRGQDPGKPATQQWTYHCRGDVSRAEWKTGQVAAQGAPAMTLRKNREGPLACDVTKSSGGAGSGELDILAWGCKASGNSGRRGSHRFHENFLGPSSVFPSVMEPGIPQ